MSPVALRPMLPADAPLIAALFRASIEELTADDYDQGQRDAWAGRADDEAAFATRLAGQLTLIAMRDRETAGFASLKGADHLDMLFVAPDHAGQGVGSALLDAVIRLAGARGAVTLTVDASDTAQEFFAKRGFTPTVRKTVPIDDQWLGNTSMQRKLAPAPDKTA